MMQARFVADGTEIILILLLGNEKRLCFYHRGRQLHILWGKIYMKNQKEEKLGFCALECSSHQLNQFLCSIIWASFWCWKDNRVQAFISGRDDCLQDHINCPYLVGLWSPGSINQQVNGDTFNFISCIEQGVSRFLWGWEEECFPFDNKMPSDPKSSFFIRKHFIWSRWISSEMNKMTLFKKKKIHEHFGEGC